MQSVWSMEISSTRDLFEFLKKKSIPVELRVTTQESGLDYGELLVPNDVYDRACDIVEAWQKVRSAAEARMQKLPCPKCRSIHRVLVPRDTDGYTFRCLDCGCDYDS